MAKKKGGAKPAPAADLDEATAAQVASLKAEGDKQFGSKAFNKAFDTYGKAVKLVTAKDDKALFHSNRAACLMMLKKHKDAVKECSAALDAQPGYTKALARRARAYEQQGRYKDALADIVAVNKGEAATDDTRAQEQRLKDYVSGKRSAGAPSLPQRPATRPQGVAFTAKAVLDDETRVLQFAQTITFAQLKELVRAKFAGLAEPLKAFNLKYIDTSSDVVTMTSQQDVQVALSDLVQSASRTAGAHGPKLSQAMLPSLRLQVLRCEDKDELPVPPQEAAQLTQLRAEMERLQIAAMQQKVQQAQKAAAAAQGKAEPEQVVELDEWLVDFAHLFREIMGFDPDRHIDLHNEGWEKCTAALDEAVKSDKAMPLFEQAADRFKEVTATGLYNWGNVHMCIARKLCDEAVAKGGKAAEVAKAAEEHFVQAEQRYREALDYKADFFDAILGLGQLAFERAKIAAGFLVAPPKAEGEVSKAQQAAQAAAVTEALGNLKAKDVKDSAPHFETAHSLFKKALNDIPEEAEKRLADQRAKEGSTDEMTLHGQVLVMWGNVQYEHSQLLAAVGDEAWKQSLDDAVAKFKEAGCKAEDIRNAVSNHTKKDDLDLDAYGPPPEEKKEEAAEKPKEAAEKEVKGLPSLGKPKGKK